MPSTKLDYWLQYLANILSSIKNHFSMKNLQLYASSWSMLKTEIYRYVIDKTETHHKK